MTSLESLSELYNQPITGLGDSVRVQYKIEEFQSIVQNVWKETVLMFTSENNDVISTNSQYYDEIISKLSRISHLLEEMNLTPTNFTVFVEKWVPTIIHHIKYNGNQTIQIVSDENTKQSNTTMKLSEVINVLLIICHSIIIYFRSSDGEISNQVITIYGIFATEVIAIIRATLCQYSNMKKVFTILCQVKPMNILLRYYSLKQGNCSSSYSQPIKQSIEEIRKLLLDILFEEKHLLDLAHAKYIILSAIDYGHERERDHSDVLVHNTSNNNNNNDHKNESSQLKENKIIKIKDKISDKQSYQQLPYSLSLYSVIVSISTASNLNTMNSDSMDAFDQMKSLYQIFIEGSYQLAINSSKNGKTNKSSDQIDINMNINTKNKNRFNLKLNTFRQSDENEDNLISMTQLTIGNRRRHLIRIIKFAMASISHLLDFTPLNISNQSLESLQTYLSRLHVSNTFLTILSSSLGGSLPYHEDFDQHRADLVTLMSFVMNTLEQIFDYRSHLHGKSKVKSKSKDIDTDEYRMEFECNVVIKCIEMIVSLSEIDHHVITSDKNLNKKDEEKNRNNENINEKDNQKHDEENDPQINTTHTTVKIFQLVSKLFMTFYRSSSIQNNSNNLKNSIQSLILCIIKHYQDLRKMDTLLTSILQSVISIQEQSDTESISMGFILSDLILEEPIYSVVFNTMLEIPLSHIHDYWNILIQSIVQLKDITVGNLISEDFHNISSDVKYLVCSMANILSKAHMKLLSSSYASLDHSSDGFTNLVQTFQSIKYIFSMSIDRMTKPVLDQKYRMILNTIECNIKLVQLCTFIVSDYISSDNMEYKQKKTIQFIEELRQIQSVVHIIVSNSMISSFLSSNDSNKSSITTSVDFMEENRNWLILLLNIIQFDINLYCHIPMSFPPVLSYPGKTYENESYTNLSKRSYSEVENSITSLDIILKLSSIVTLEAYADAIDKAIDDLRINSHFNTDDNFHNDTEVSDRRVFIILFTLFEYRNIWQDLNIFSFDKLNRWLKYFLQHSSLQDIHRLLSTQRSTDSEPVLYIHSILIAYDEIQSSLSSQPPLTSSHDGIQSTENKKRRRSNQKSPSDFTSISIDEKTSFRTIFSIKSLKKIQNCLHILPDSYTMDPILSEFSDKNEEGSIKTMFQYYIILYEFMFLENHNMFTISKKKKNQTCIDSKSIDVIQVTTTLSILSKLSTILTTYLQKRCDMSCIIDIDMLIRFLSASMTNKEKILFTTESIQSMLRDLMSLVSWIQCILIDQVPYSMLFSDKLLQFFLSMSSYTIRNDFTRIFQCYVNRIESIPIQSKILYHLFYSNYDSDILSQLENFIDRYSQDDIDRRNNINSIYNINHVMADSIRLYSYLSYGYSMISKSSSTQSKKMYSNSNDINVDNSKVHDKLYDKIGYWFHRLISLSSQSHQSRNIVSGYLYLIAVVCRLISKPIYISTNSFYVIPFDMSEKIFQFILNLSLDLNLVVDNNDNHDDNNSNNHMNPPDPSTESIETAVQLAVSNLLHSTSTEYHFHLYKLYVSHIQSFQSYNTSNVNIIKTLAIWKVLTLSILSHSTQSIEERRDEMENNEKDEERWSSNQNNHKTIDRDTNNIYHQNSSLETLITFVIYSYSHILSHSNLKNILIAVSQSEDINISQSQSFMKSENILHSLMLCEESIRLSIEVMDYLHSLVTHNPNHDTMITVTTTNISSNNSSSNIDTSNTYTSGIAIPSISHNMLSKCIDSVLSGLSYQISYIGNLSNSYLMYYNHSFESNHNIQCKIVTILKKLIEGIEIFVNILVVRNFLMQSSIGTIICLLRTILSNPILFHMNTILDKTESMFECASEYHPNISIIMNSILPRIFMSISKIKSLGNHLELVVSLLLDLFSRLLEIQSHMSRHRSQNRSQNQVIGNLSYFFEITDGIRYGMYQLFDHCDPKQRKKIFNMLLLLPHPCARELYQELNRSYSMDYKFIGKA